MMKFFTDILTGADNETFDHSRLLCVLSHLVYFAMAIASFIIHKPWSPIDFATGIGTMAVGYGVNLHLKSKTEPSAT